MPTMQPVTDSQLPILSKPVAHNIQIITDYEAVNNLLQAEVLRWRDGEIRAAHKPSRWYPERHRYAIRLEA